HTKAFGLFKPNNFGVTVCKAGVLCTFVGQLGGTKRRCVPVVVMVGDHHHFSGLGRPHHLVVSRGDRDDFTSQKTPSFMAHGVVVHVLPKGAAVHDVQELSAPANTHHRDF